MPVKNENIPASARRTGKVKRPIQSTRIMGFPMKTLRIVTPMDRRAKRDSGSPVLIGLVKISLYLRLLEVFVCGLPGICFQFQRAEGVLATRGIRLNTNRPHTPGIDTRVPRKGGGVNVSCG